MSISPAGNAARGAGLSPMTVVGRPPGCPSGYMPSSTTPRTCKKRSGGSWAPFQIGKGPDERCRNSSNRRPFPGAPADCLGPKGKAQYPSLSAAIFRLGDPSHFGKLASVRAMRPAVNFVLMHGSEWCYVLKGQVRGWTSSRSGFGSPSERPNPTHGLSLVVRSRQRCVPRCQPAPSKLATCDSEIKDARGLVNIIL